MNELKKREQISFGSGLSSTSTCTGISELRYLAYVRFEKNCSYYQYFEEKIIPNLFDLVLNFVNIVINNSNNFNVVLHHSIVKITDSTRQIY